MREEPDLIRLRWDRQLQKHGPPDHRDPIKTQKLFTGLYCTDDGDGWVFFFDLDADDRPIFIDYNEAYRRINEQVARLNRILGAFPNWAKQPQ